MQATGSKSGSGAEVAQAKGSNFIGLLQSVEKLYGLAARERVLSLAPTELAAALSEGQVLRIGWYPVTWYADLYDATQRALGAPPGLARALGHDATLADFSTVHRLMVSMLSVEMAFGQAHRLLSLYWKGGTVERVDLKRGQGHVRFAGWVGFSRLVWEDIIGSTEGLLSFCGAKNIRCRAGGSLESTQTVDLEVRWI